MTKPTKTEPLRATLDRCLAETRQAYAQAKDLAGDDTEHGLCTEIMRLIDNLRSRMAEHDLLYT